MPKKILLADDSITIQKVVELTFSDGDYEVTAVNNGARAIQKLSEMRPDIILSDIIMPEKNGYEVCEFVKSHPDYRNIPVVLLTGTFEPFDPDRADKAGCDAVVTKPFESQSLIHKVEELIEQARASAPASTAPQPVIAAAPPPPPPPPAPKAPEPSPWVEETPAPPAASPFASAPSFSPAPPPSFEHEADIFGAVPSQDSPTTEMPFDAPPPAGETRAFPKMSFDDQASTQQVPAQGGETRAFPKMDFSSLPGTSETAPPPPPPPPAPEAVDESPFGAPPSAEAFSGETRAFPKMSFDDLQKMMATPPPAPPAAEPATSPWDAQPAPSGETRAFPQMNFEEMSRAAEASPAWGAESVAPPIEPEARAPMSAPSPGFEAAEEPMPAPSEPAWSVPPPPPPAMSTGNGTDLTEEQIDRIARRVVQLMSDQVVRNIAWEVIPDLAEMVVKERIRQLESES